MTLHKLLFAMAAGAVFAAHSQTEIYSHNFDDMSINSWTESADATGNNIWVTNQTYTGNTNAGIGNVPAQPNAIAYAPNSNYMHITSLGNCMGFVPVTCNAHYVAADSSDRAMEMLNGISTVGLTNVTLHFWYLCQGDTGHAYGKVEYTVDGGQTWNAVAPTLVSVNDWTELSIAQQDFDGQQDLRFRFRWHNDQYGNGGDLALSIDDIRITTGTPPPGSIAVADPSTHTFCAETDLAVEFTPSGTYNAGNLFTAQLSDANGSFASPLAIGTLLSSASSAQTIDATIPGSVTPGSNYHIRVVSSDPVVIGSENATNLTVEDCAALEEESVLFFRLYPNPAGDMVTISYDTDATVSSIELLDQNGRYLTEVPVFAKEIDFSLLGQGIYLIRVTSEQGVFTQRVTKN